MLIEDQHPHNKSIMVAVLGQPNVGKSSLINKMIGLDLGIVTPKAQTTRNRYHCNFQVGLTEIVLVDTPGLHQSGQELNKRLNQEAKEGAFGADLNLILIDLTREVFPQIKQIISQVGENLKTSWIVFTKTDLVEHLDELPLKDVFSSLQKYVPQLEQFFSVSSVTGERMDQLIEALVQKAPNAPHLYPGGDLSNKNERFFVAEYVREQAFLKLQEELPYELAVLVEDFVDTSKVSEKIVAKISATIIVNRPSQRAIVVGRGGQVIKDIGREARTKIENLLGGKVMLNLHVKVAPRWFKNNFILEELGLPRAPESHRVWRQK